MKSYLSSCKGKINLFIFLCSYSYIDVCFHLLVSLFYFHSRQQTINACANLIFQSMLTNEKEILYKIGLKWIKSNKNKLTIHFTFTGNSQRESGT